MQELTEAKIWLRPGRPEQVKALRAELSSASSYDIATRTALEARSEGEDQGQRSRRRAPRCPRSRGGSRRRSRRARGTYSS